MTQSKPLTRNGQAVIDCIGTSPENCSKCPFSKQECELVWEAGSPDETSKFQSRERLGAILNGRA